MTIFFIDLDGTVIDSKKRVYDLFIDLTRLEISFDAYWDIKKRNQTNHFIIQRFNVDSEKQFPDFNRKWFELIETKEYLLKDTLVENTIESLQILSKKGKLVLITNRQYSENVNRQLEEFGIRSFFYHLLVTEHRITKPLILKDWLHINNLKLTGENAFVVGDTEEDFKSGQENNLSKIAVMSGFRSENYLKQFSFDGFYKTLFEFSETQI